MGREVKRVPIDFNWPVKKTWEGFLNPLHVAAKCSVCRGDSYSPVGRWLHARWYGHVPFFPEERGSVPLTPDHPLVSAFAQRNLSNSPSFYGRSAAALEREATRLCDMWNGQWSHHLNDDDVAALVASGRLMDFTHTFTPGAGWRPRDPAYMPSAKEVNEWGLRSFGHDSLNSWACVEAECERLGSPSACSACDGEGEIWPSAEAKKAHEDWVGTEPPKGDGWQMWETTSEGSPISPVFETPELLAQWLANTNASAFGGKGATYESWLGMIKGPAWAPSAVMVDGKMMSGVEALSEPVHRNVSVPKD